VTAPPVASTNSCGSIPNRSFQVPAAAHIRTTATSRDPRTHLAECCDQREARRLWSRQLSALKVLNSVGAERGCTPLGGIDVRKHMPTWRLERFHIVHVNDEHLGKVESPSVFASSLVRISLASNALDDCADARPEILRPSCSNTSSNETHTSGLTRMLAEDLGDAIFAMTRRSPTTSNTSFGLTFGAPVASTVASQHSTDRVTNSCRISTPCF